jgi:hypothetical protein
MDTRVLEMPRAAEGLRDPGPDPIGARDARPGGWEAR